MKRFLHLVLIAVAVFAQDPAKPKAAKPDAAKPESAASAPLSEEQQPAEPLVISTEVGFRGLFGQHGSNNAYRSVVNLGEGPRLLSLQSTIAPTSGQLFDVLRLTGNNWGDPFNSARLSIDKNSAYRYTLNYRNLAYFNALPSFANPQFSRLTPDSFAVNQRSLDTRYRMLEMDLDLRPAKRLRPFFGFGRQSGDGSGVSPFVADENSYPISSRIDYRYLSMRAGLHVDLEPLHVTFEQGGALFSDNESLFQLSRLTGNRPTTYLGQQLALNSAAQVYNVEGNNKYSSVSLTAPMTKWIDLTGQFYYSRPDSEIQFNDAAAGTLLWLDTLRFANGQQSLSNGFANQPRTSAAFGAEVRPWSKVRLVEFLQTDRLTNTSALLTSVTLDQTSLAPLNLSDRLVWRQHEQRLQAFFDVSKWLTVYAGHRFLWGDSEVRRAQLAPGETPETGALRRHSALSGFVLRPHTRLRMSADTEIGRGDRTYFRNSLQDFEKIRLRTSYQLNQSLSVSGRYVRLRNTNPTPGVNLDFTSQATGALLSWTRKTTTISADYTRSSIVNLLTFLNPETFRPLPSDYRDIAHTATLLADLRLARERANLSFGGSLVRTRGSRPTRFYQPMVRLSVPVGRRAGLFAEWRNFSLGQSAFAYEAFGVNQLTAGIRLSR